MSGYAPQKSSGINIKRGYDRCDRCHRCCRCCCRCYCRRCHCSAADLHHISLKPGAGSPDVTYLPTLLGTAHAAKWRGAATAGAMTLTASNRTRPAPCAAASHPCRRPPSHRRRAGLLRAQTKRTWRSHSPRTPVCTAGAGMSWMRTDSTSGRGAGRGMKNRMIRSARIRPGLRRRGRSSASTR